MRIKKLEHFKPKIPERYVSLYEGKKIDTSKLYKGKYKYLIDITDEDGITGKIHEWLDGEWGESEFVSEDSYYSDVTMVDSYREELTNLYPNGFSYEILDLVEERSIAIEAFRDIEFAERKLLGKQVSKMTLVSTSTEGEIPYILFLKMSKNAEKDMENYYDSSIAEVKAQAHKESWNKALENWLAWADDEVFELDDEYVTFFDASGLDRKNVLETINNNQRTKGTASLALIGYENDYIGEYNEGVFDQSEAVELLRRMGVAEHRHKNTDYDRIDKSNMSDEDVARLRRSRN